MSAKPSKKGANQPVRAAASATPATAVAGSAVSANDTPVEPSWIDSTDPKKQMWGKIIFVGIWIYVAALWLLALDQTFNWGIFGPKLPPTP